MQEIILDEKFERILPALDEIAYNDLERDILLRGCLMPLVLWNGILIDGYHRYGILTKHDLPFNTISMEFDSRDEVIDWIIEHQIARRNLTPMQLSYYRGYRYNLDKQIRGANNQHTIASNILASESEKGQNVTQAKTQSTASKLAEQYNVSSRTIKRDALLANAINKIGETSPETKIDILSGKTKISRKQLKELTGDSEADITDAVNQIIDGTFKSKKAGAYAPGGGNTNDAAEYDNMQPWEITFAKMTDEFRQALRTHAKTDDTTSVRSALRQYIEMLENLYNNI